MYKKYLVLFVLFTFTYQIPKTSAAEDNYLPLNILVDRSNCLPADYNPEVLSEAQIAIEKLIEVAEGNGVKIHINSSFRSFALQKSLHKRKPSVTAPTECSEHQLGTTFDVAWPGNYSHWIGENELVWTWLKDNSHLYGFVISYPYKECLVKGSIKNNNYSPGCGVEYKWEPWHIRFVGKDLASKIYNAGYLDPKSEVLPQHFYIRLNH